MVEGEMILENDIHFNGQWNFCVEKGMEKDEFEYRYGMFDRFVRVLLEGPHEKLINKLGL